MRTGSDGLQRGEGTGEGTLFPELTYCASPRETGEGTLFPELTYCASPRPCSNGSRKSISETTSRTSPAHRRLTLLAVVIHHADLVEVDQAVTDCRDSKDNKFLQLAVSGHATHLVTGDQDLLVLHPYRHIAILTAREFLAEVARSS